MLIQAQLFFIGNLVFLTDSAPTHPSKGHRRRQADSSPGLKLQRNLMPIIPNDYNFPGLQLVQNKELMYPTNFDSQQSLVYFPRNTANEAKPDETLASSKEVRGISDLISRDRKPVLRDQRKQSRADEVEPCGHYHKNDYNMLTDIIGKMSPEARNALIDALLKTLMDKPKVSSVKSGDVRVQQHPLDAALQPPLRMNNKPNTLVQPFSLTVEREKLRDLYKYLNNERLQDGLKKANFTVNLGDLVQECVKKEGCQCGTTKKCCHKQSTTMTPVVETTTPTTTSTSNPEEEDDNEYSCSCSCDQYSDLPSNIAEFGGGKVINLTQIFNVHPKLLIVNSGQFTPTDIAGLLSGTQNTGLPTTPEPTPPHCHHTTTTTTATTMTTISTSTTLENQPSPSRVQETLPTQPSISTVTRPAVPATSRMSSKFPNSRKRCTRRFNRHGYKYRYDRRQHVNPMKNLVYTYYMDMDDPRAQGD